MSFENPQLTHIESATEPGIDAQRGIRPMQDVVFWTATPDGYLVGVFDGHGPAGHEYANATVDAVLMTVSETGALEHQVATVSGAIEGVGNEVALNGKDGSAAVTVAIVRGNTVATLQLGNSGAMFFPAADAGRSERLTARREPVASKPEATAYAVTEPGTLVVATDGLFDAPVEDLAELLDASRNPNHAMPPNRRGRLAELLARLGYISTGDDVAVVTVEFE